MSSLLATAFEKEANKILFSQHYFSLTEKHFAKHSKLNESWQSLIKELIDKTNGVVKIEEVKTNGVSLNTSDEFESIYNCADRKYLLAIAASPLAYKNNIPALILSNDSYRPFDSAWLKLNLAAKSEISFQHTDFISEKEVTELFHSFFKLKSDLPNDEIYIFTRDPQFYKADKYQSIAKKGVKIKVFARDFQGGKRDSIDSKEHVRIKNIIKSIFGPRYEYWVANTPDMIHERKIIYDIFMLLADDDFDNLDKQRKTWHISIKMSSESVKNYLSKCGSFAKK